MTEAEYNALTLAMRSVLPFLNTVKEIAHKLGLPEDPTCFKTTVWEDNSGALALANMEPGRTTPRSKHYAIKMHWFRSKVHADQNMHIRKISTHEQRADILTKGLKSDVFKKIRRLLCGW